MMFFHVYLVSEETSDTTEALNKLEALLGLVSNKFNLGSEVLEIVAQPFSQVVLLHHFKICT
jgi:hypothetical protein